MTSEVLMLNKDAVVIAADSAVTTGRDPHPRYSKAANKIFDISVHGNVAVTIFASAEIDRVPWELVLKQFRKFDSENPPRAHLRDYVSALVNFFQRNGALFPVGVRTELLKTRVTYATGTLLKRLAFQFPVLIDQAAVPADRQAAWAEARAFAIAELAAQPYRAPLTAPDLQSIVAQSADLEAHLAPLIASDSSYLHVDVSQVVPLAIEYLLKYPTEVLGATGVVIAGYGADEIFPSFVQTRMFGHIGDTFFWTEESDYVITHDNNAWIQPFAQSSMINRFTDGFDGVLSSILEEGSLSTFNSLIGDLRAGGIAIPDEVSNPIVTARHTEFMSNWKQKNWDANFHPLRRVLNSLSVPEMGHLAESLLVLEALRERVTSPSESVGGPIDVAVITKAEGLIWLKRKHFFEPSLNLRYLNRIK